MELPTLRTAPAQLVCLGTAIGSAAYYVDWAPNFYWGCALAGVAFAVDLIKPQMFTLAIQSYRDRENVAAFVAGGLALILAAVSMLAVDGLLMRLRSDAGGGRANIQKVYDRAKADYDKASAELDTIGRVEPAAALEARVESSVPVATWRRTKQCTEVTQENSRRECEPALKLREQIAVSKRAADLEADRKAAKDKLDRTERPQSADPQVEAIAKASGLSEASVMLAIIWAIGFAVELLSCFGPALMAPKPPPPPPVEEPKPEPMRSIEQKALAWLKEEVGRAAEGKLVVLNAAIAAKFDVDPATVTRWRAKWADAGLIRETKEGRQITIRLPRRKAV